SGDLAPLAHLALVLIGEGMAEHEDEIISGKEALSRANLQPLILEEKDGLALLNGTAAMTSLACLSLHDATVLVSHALLASAMTLDSLEGSIKPFDGRIHKARPHPGQMKVARGMQELLKDSGILKGHADCSRVQDAYSLRCVPQVLGAVVDTISFAKDVLTIEMNSATDNPLVFGKDSISGGNFHGEPVALVSDYLAIALSEVANISERRTARLLDRRLSNLPPFLTENVGLNSGYMVAQYTAASLASENKVLAHPASVDTIPTSANQEDHVSMGTTASRKLAEIVKNTKYVVAIEMLVAVQALDFHQLTSSPLIEDAKRQIRDRIPSLKEDREIHVDINAMTKLMDEEEILTAGKMRCFLFKDGV
ncbi:MAG TPA: histidine ammonia-lyase, partial [Euryarchaeota archaeon]|nr:histidine ammonia-lyase [Euryarchaeota archaeon]